MTGRVTISVPVPVPVIAVVVAVAVAARECDVPGCSSRGLPNKGIACQLGIRAKTVGNHAEQCTEAPGVGPALRRRVPCSTAVRSTAAPVD